MSARLAFLSAASEAEQNLHRKPRNQVAFTEREQQIAALMVEGKNNREIASQIFMSEGTVKNYISVIYQKIGMNDRAKAILALKEMLS